MLVLTRKLNESILIGDAGLEITILEIKGGRIRLGIKAPAEVPVRRKELAERDVPEPAAQINADLVNDDLAKAVQIKADWAASQGVTPPALASEVTPDSAPTLTAAKPRRGTDFEMPVCEFAGV